MNNFSTIKFFVNLITCGTNKETGEEGEEKRGGEAKKPDSVEMGKTGFCKAIGLFMVVSRRILGAWGRVGGRVRSHRKEIPWPSSRPAVQPCAWCCAVLLRLASGAMGVTI